MTPRIEPGQRWRRKSDGVEVEVVEVDRHWDDVTYRNLSTRRRGTCFGYHWRTRYDLIAEAPR